jgi:hypothetical protein
MSIVSALCRVNANSTRSQPRRLHTAFCAFVVAGACQICLAAGAASAAEVTPAPVEAPPAGAEGSAPVDAAASVDEATLRAWVADLGADDYQAREAATRRLEQAGAPAVALLGQAASEGSLEVTCRAIRSLQAIAASKDPQAFETAQAVLEKLSESKHRSAARRADLALAGLGQARSKHAVARIKELGGKVKPVALPRGIQFPDDEEPPVAQIILRKSWKGGDEGLAFLKRVATLQTVYIVKGANVSEEALEQFQRARPNIVIQRRGEAMLGVSCTSDGTALQIRIVQPNSAAEKCGLQEGNEIVRYESEDVTTFERLIEITSTRSAGDNVTLEVRREGKLLPPIVATLGEWE